MIGGNVTDMNCPECMGEIKSGIAIHPDKEYAARYLINQPPINYKTMKLISVYKCKNCGYSYETPLEAT